ncbi:MAG: HNH endonuclease [Thermoplasmata archaeon]|nr:HNH endonuclease [Thermoplasmata archaeon]
MADPLENVAVPELAAQLSKIRELFGQILPSEELQATIRGFQSQRGIYKPAGSNYALWIRQTLTSPYADKRIEWRPDGSWTYFYSPESRDGRADLSLPTNAGLLRCRDDRIPVGVFRQVGGPSGLSEYEVMGLAYVEAFDGDHFVIRGEAIDWTTSPVPENVEPVFHPFESSGPMQAQSLRTMRDHRFSEVVRRVYNERCALCNVGYRLRGRPIGVEAAHIIPVEANGVIGDVRNGLLLCRNHHALFDRNAWTVDEDLRVGLTADSEFRKSAAKNHVLSWEGKRLLNLPSRDEDRPAVEALRWRLDAFQKYWH